MGHAITLPKCSNLFSSCLLALKVKLPFQHVSLIRPLIRHRLWRPRFTLITIKESLSIHNYWWYDCALSRENLKLIEWSYYTISLWGTKDLEDCNFSPSLTKEQFGSGKSIYCKWTIGTPVCLPSFSWWASFPFFIQEHVFCGCTTHFCFLK